MTGTVESAGGVAKVEGKAAEPSKSSPADLLKKAVSGKVAAKVDPAPAAAEATPPRRWSVALDGRLAAIATVALVVGTSFGLVAAPRERSGDALARIEAALDADRSESGRLNAELERLSKALASLRETADGARTEMRAVAPGLNERVGRLEQALDRKLTALGDRVIQSERDQAAAAAATEKRAALPASTPTTAAAASTPKPEPTQTASIAETKPKSDAVEAWAVRDVYQGVAMLEDRKRRLIEVAPGDSVPGIGRVEAIERRGRTWVVVTRQGVIGPQSW